MLAPRLPALLAASLFAATAACPTNQELGHVGPKASGSSSEKPSAAPSAAAEKWACAADGDCMMSCSKGAVSRQWYEARDFLTECKGGCAEGREARCVDGGCAAFQQRGDADPGCTRR